MRGTFTFSYNMNDEFERSRAMTMLKGEDYKCCLREVLQLFRQKLKYEELTEEVYEALDKMREDIFRITQECDLDTVDL